jgi:hypothetical protein
VVLASAALCYRSPVVAQISATLGMNGSRVEYEGFLASGAATITPALRFDSRNISLGTQGSWTVFESGNQIFQFTGAAAWLANLHKLWRFELSAAAGASRYADHPTSSHVLTRGRLHLAGARTGAWLGATTGEASDSTGSIPLEFSLGAWSVGERFAVVGTITSTKLGWARHVDMLVAARWTGERVELEARAGARPWTQSNGAIGEAVTGAFAEVSAFVPLGSRIALALGAGSYPSDPVRRVLAAKYVTAGFRLTIAGSDNTDVPLVSGPTRVAFVDHGSSGSSAEPRLEIDPAGDGHTLRVYAPKAISVEMMGDFTDWKPSALSRAGDAIWILRLPLTAGVHRLNIRINGGEWVVPAGARSEEGEFGAVGIIVVR